MIEYPTTKKDYPTTMGEYPASSTKKEFTYPSTGTDDVYNKHSTTGYPFTSPVDYPTTKPNPQKSTDSGII